MEIYKIAQGEQIELNFADHKAVKDLLIQLHDYYDLSWPQIAALPSINPPGENEIPFSTLAKIARIGIVPEKWRSRFPGVGAIDNRPRISIHKINMRSASQTIINNLTPENKFELIKYLAEDPDLPAVIMILTKGTQP